MKHCQKCNIDYNTTRMTCPFCRQTLSNNNLELGLSTQYPKYLIINKQKNLLLKIFSFLSLLALAVCLITNILTFNQSKSIWCLVVFLALLVGWSISYLIRRKNYFARYLAISVFFLAFLLMSIEYIDLSEERLVLGWSIKYLIPFLISVTILVITLRMVIFKNHFKNDVRYSIFLSIIAKLYLLILIFCPVDKNDYWPIISLVGVGVFNLIGLFLFASRRTLIELKKYFNP